MLGIKNMAAINKRSGEIDRDLQDHKLYVANNYAKEVTTQASLSRIHDRMDSMNEKMDDGFRNISDKMDSSVTAINNNIQALARGKK